MDCIFCKIINKEINAKLRYEDDDLLAFDDIHPKAPIHILIIPKKHIPTLNDVNDNETLLVGKMIRAAQKIAREANIADEGYRVVINCNRQGGQEVYHIHLHLFGGKQLTWPRL